MNFTIKRVGRTVETEKDGKKASTKKWGKGNVLEIAGTCCAMQGAKTRQKQSIPETMWVNFLVYCGLRRPAFDRRSLEPKTAANTVTDTQKAGTDLIYLLRFG